MKKKIVLQGMLTLGCLLLVLISITVAWFSQKTTSEIEPYTINVASSTTFEISLDGVNYSNLVNLEFDPANVLLKDVTTVLSEVDGRKSLLVLRPTKDDYSGEPILNNGTWLNAKKTSIGYDDVERKYIATNPEKAEYIEFYIWIRSTSNLDIYVGSETSVEPLEEDGKALYCVDTNGTKVYYNSRGQIVNNALSILNESPYYHSSNENTVKKTFSNNLIVGAVRVSFSEMVIVDETEKENLKYIWNPHPEYHLYSDGIGSYFEIDSGEGISPLSHEYYTYNQGSSSYIKTVLGVESSNLKTTNFQSTNSSIANDENPICTTNLTSGSDFSIKKILVRLWIEGTDREARNALFGSSITGGGKFSMNLQFVSYFDEVIISEDIDSRGINTYSLNARRQSIQDANTDYTWVSSNNEIATVDNGVVTFLQSGTAVIEAIFNENNSLRNTYSITHTFTEENGS